MVELAEARDHLAEAPVLEERLNVFLRSNGGTNRDQRTPWQETAVFEERLKVF
jgi:hypothetical protein